MADVIFGTVTNIVDGDTLDIERVSSTQFNKFPYRARERVRLSGCDAPERGRPGSAAATRRLQRRYLGKRVRVDVEARDTYRRVIGFMKVE